MEGGGRSRPSRDCSCHPDYTSMKTTFSETSTSSAVPFAHPERCPVDAPRRRECDTCGSTYDKAFQVIMDGQTHVFDCFECAIQLLAPKCAHCGCRIIGHGMEEGGQFFCCAHCAGQEGAEQVTDRA